MRERFSNTGTASLMGGMSPELPSLSPELCNS